jgi:adenylate cyclase
MSNTQHRKPTVKRVRGRAASDEVTQLHQLELLLNVSKTVAAFETLDDILTILIEIMSTELDAERSTLFLNDPRTGELYSRIAQGNFRREIRFLNTTGLAGHVYSSGQGVIVHDAYADPRFNRSIDEQTGFVTKSILCAPIKTVKGGLLGVAQALNKQHGQFTSADLALLEAMTMQAAIALQTAESIERLQKTRVQEMEFVEVVSNITSEIDLTALLHKVMGEATKMLDAERSTLFLNDEKTSTLFTVVGEGLEATQIRFPNHRGIAGAVFTSREAVNIPYAYADLRFNPTIDKQTGYFTRSILCVPVINKAGKTIGVTQVLNKRSGPFTAEDESRLRAFTAQVAIALENAKLFNDVQNMKNYNESILESMPSAVITLDEDGKITTCNSAGLRMMRVVEADILGRRVQEFFTGPNTWILDRARRVEETQTADIAMGADMAFDGQQLSVNVTILPLRSVEHKKLGSLIMLDDISNEKRMKTTMSRYMDPSIADQLLAEGAEVLGGKSTTATILFSDIRGFTPLTEELGPQATVALLNEYFTVVVDCIQRQGGMLDKFVGDAMMAVFGLPIPHDDDEDRAVRAAIAMLTDLATWNVERLAHGKKAVAIGIGINTDVVVSGNIGSPKRMDYTLIGDGVNLASRLESACKQYVTQILISEYTYKKLRGTYRIREIDRVVVKGKTEPVSVYEVLDYHTDATFPHLMRVVHYFQEGLMQYRRQRWDEASDAFTAALDLHAGDALSQLYIQRCQYLKEHPPGPDWTGVWVMESK